MYNTKNSVIFHSLKGETVLCAKFVAFPMVRNFSKEADVLRDFLASVEQCLITDCIMWLSKSTASLC